MSAELLRRAANAIRLRVGATLTPGSWEADGVHVYGNGRTADDCRFWVGDMRHDPSHDGTHGHDEAAYVALMHPPVALALAEWFEAAAEDLWDMGSGRAGEAVARAILREDPS